jgi:outer membrane protein OmpA-like peptidoglycan-associated protein
VVNIDEEKENMRRKPVVTCIFMCVLVLVSVGSLWAEEKRRVDLMGQEVTPEAIINALQPPPPPTARFRSLEPATKKSLEPGLPTAVVKILFAFNSATISPGSTQVLNAIGTALQSPSLVQDRFRIEGHTDNVGNDGYNVKLSARRAQSVKEYLTNNFGIDANRLTAVGRGKSEPLDEQTANTPEGQRKNRRVEIVNLQKQ